MLNLSIMLLRVNDFWRIVILNRIDKRPVLSNHSKLNDMVWKFFPFKPFVSIDVNLSKQLDKVLNETDLIWSFRQMFKHYFDVLLKR